VIPDAALSKLPETLRKSILSERERLAAERAARYTKGPPLTLGQKVFNRALREMQDAATSLEAVQRDFGTADLRFRRCAMRYAETKAAAQLAGERCQGELARPLTDAEWVRGFEDPYREER